MDGFDIYSLLAGINPTKKTTKSKSVPATYVKTAQENKKPIKNPVAKKIPVNVIEVIKGQDPQQYKVATGTPKTENTLANTLNNLYSMFKNVLVQNVQKPEYKPPPLPIHGTLADLVNWKIQKKNYDTQYQTNLAQYTNALGKNNTLNNFALQLAQAMLTAPSKQNDLKSQATIISSAINALTKQASLTGIQNPALDQILQQALAKVGITYQPPKSLEDMWKIDENTMKALKDLNGS